MITKFKGTCFLIYVITGAGISHNKENSLNLQGENKDTSYNRLEQRI